MSKLKMNKELFNVELKKKLDSIVKNDLIKSRIEYSLISNGKRLRPLLMFEFANEFNLDYNYVLDAAVAIEIMHTYTLVHDDLPCMDNDDYRRGELTNHKKYNESTAVLVGDALNTMAFNVIANSDYNNEVKISLIKLLSDVAGADDLILGQLLDIDSEGKLIKFDKLKLIHKLKTASLFKYCFLSILILADKLELKEEYVEFANNLGLAYQIKDDIIDVLNQNETGKDKFSDIKNNKSTYVTILGGKKALIEFNIIRNQVIEKIEHFKLKNKELKNVLNKILKR